MSILRTLAGIFLLAAPAVAQETYKAEPLKAEVPAEVAEPIRKELGESGVRVLNADGKPFAEVWLRKAIPASGKPSGAKGTLQFPVLTEGELLGVVRYVAEGHDYRDQTIPPGVYTLRYGLQPVNGDHLGVSPYRDYGLLLPAAKDKETSALAKKALEKGSAETAGASHPAVLMLLAAPGGGKPEPKVIRDEEKNISGVVLGLPLGGAAQGDTLAVQLIIAGMAM